MTDWLVQQQGVLSIALIFTICCEKFLSRKLNAAFAYQLWFLIPFTLIANNLPSTSLPFVSQSVSRYIINVGSTAEMPALNVLLILWTVGVAGIVMFVSYHYYILYQSLTHEDSHNVLNQQFYTSSVATTPMLFGFIKPRIIVPLGFTEQFNSKQQSMILEHERVHFMHRDHLWNLLALTFATVFWFNPLVWVALRSFRINQELACDAKVLEYKSQVDKIDYASALVQCAEYSPSNITPYPTFGEKSTMIKRINLIKQPVSSSRAISIAAILLGSIFTTHTVLANLAPPSSTHNSEINLATPIMRVNPEYPKDAAEKGVEGSVILEFDITKKGSTDNIKVIESFPKGTFDSSAVDALKQWEYKPRIQGGQAQRQTALLVQLDFRVEKEKSHSSTDVEKIKIPAH
jgi:TonB family protein